MKAVRFLNTFMSNRPAEDNHWNWLHRTLRSTRWSLIGRMRGSAEKTVRQSSDEFCRCYWHPLYAYLRHRGYAAADAQDHVQSFLAWLLAGNLLEKADPRKGKLRNYLLTLLVRHVASRRERDQAKKRGGGAVHVSLDGPEAEAAFLRDRRFAVSPEDGFRRALAARLVAEGVAALRARYAASGQTELCAALLPALEGPLPESLYADAARTLGMRSATLRMASLRLRERFRGYVCIAAGQALGLPPGPALDQELRDLFAGSPPSGQ